MSNYLIDEYVSFLVMGDIPEEAIPTEVLINRGKEEIDRQLKEVISENRTLREQIEQLKSEHEAMNGRLAELEKMMSDGGVPAVSARELSILREAVDTSEMIGVPIAAEPLVDNTCKVGDLFYLGSWKSKRGWNRKRELLEWRVIAVEDAKALLLCNHVIDKRPYHKSGEAITWGKCDLRQWLNQEFYEEAFSDIEKTKVLLTDVVAEKNPYHNTDAGEDVLDRVFLLSIPEIYQYLPHGSERIVDTGDGKVCWWWLRSPGSFRTKASYVADGGNVAVSGCDAVKVNGVRPAIWIRLES